MSAPIQPYEFLGLDASVASLKEVSAAYYRLALLCHPDKGGTTEDMTTLTLAYQWIKEGLISAEAHRRSFEEYYQEKKSQIQVPNFTDLLAETFEYSRERFYALAAEHSIAEKYWEMLYIPAFNYAIEKNTPLTFYDHIRAFLKMFNFDTSESNVEPSTIEYYVPMSDPRGYEEVMAQPEIRPEDYHYSFDNPNQSDPVSMERSLVALLEPTTNTATATTFTELSKPIPVYDYEEAFKSVPYQGSIKTLPEPPKEFQERVAAKLLERELQIQNLG
jgi:DnaJ domain